jgi:predicted transcriptional regulator of viral defense system
MYRINKRTPPPPHSNTMKSGDKIIALAQFPEKIFHTGDIANIWLIQNKNTLYTTIRRYIKKGVLHRIYKGYYSLLPPEKIAPELMGVKALHEYAYVSLESVLFDEGYISRPPAYISFISSKSARFRIGKNSYRSRKMDDRFLYNDTGITANNGIRTASAERAIADMLYYVPEFHYDKTPDWKKVKEIQKETGYPLTPARYDFTATVRRNP